MKRPNLSAMLLLAFVVVLSCAEKSKKETPVEDHSTRIEMITSKGSLQLELYNETPLHRDNFVQLVKEKRFDSLLFHRVIENFMIQTGDPDSKTAKPGDSLGEGDLPYRVAAEMIPSLFHKKGALGAAREGSLSRGSSAMQFYLVQGEKYNDSLLDISEERINNWLAEHYFKNDTVNHALINALIVAEDAEDEALKDILNDSIWEASKSYTNFERYTIPEAHREVYKTVGGTPHLDQNYTIFGEVISGLEVIDSIAATETGALNRPKEDVWVLSVRVMDEKE